MVFAVGIDPDQAIGRRHVAGQPAAVEKCGSLLLRLDHGLQVNQPRTRIDRELPFSLERPDRQVSERDRGATALREHAHLA